MCVYLVSGGSCEAAAARCMAGEGADAMTMAAGREQAASRPQEPAAEGRRYIYQRFQGDKFRCVGKAGGVWFGGGCKLLPLTNMSRLLQNLCATPLQPAKLMAQFALAGLMGPQLKDHAGLHDFKYSCLCFPCTGSGTLSGGEDGVTLTFDNIAASFFPKVATKEAWRSSDGKNAHWFVTDGGGVWVFGKPGEPLQFYKSEDAASKGGAPMVAAMHRDKFKKQQSMKMSMSNLFGATEVKRGGVDGAQAARPVAKQAKNQRQQHQMEKQMLRDEKEAMEKAAVAEAIAFDRQKARAAKGGNDFEV